MNNFEILKRKIILYFKLELVKYNNFVSEEKIRKCLKLDIINYDKNIAISINSGLTYQLDMTINLDRNDFRILYYMKNSIGSGISQSSMNPFWAIKEILYGANFKHFILTMLKGELL